MIVTIERTPFLRALSHAQSVVDRRATVPIYNNVLLSAEGNVLTIRATDSDMEIVETVACQVEKPGATTLPAGLIHGLVSKTAEGAQIKLEPTDNGLMRVKGGRSRVDMPCLPASDFPNFRSIGSVVRFEIGAEILRGILGRVAFLASVEETRFYLCGVHLHICGGKLRAVATEGHRLGHVDIDLPDGAEDMPGIILASKTVKRVMAMTDGVDGIVAVELGDNLVRFSVGDSVLTSKLIDYEYPDYQRAVPVGTANKTAEVDRSALVGIISRASLFTEGKNRALVLNFGDGELSVAANDPSDGDFLEAMEIFYQGEPLRIGINCAYLASIAGAMAGDAMRFSMGTSIESPIITDPADGSAVYYIQPLRV